ncbi:virulence factor TspB C-terminal domain-related protein [Stenotrophomonas maltophilia]
MDLAVRMAGGLRDHFRGLQLMHWLVRVFASAIARRIAYALIALFLAWLGLSDAHAQSKNCSTSDAMCTVEEARQQCESHKPINSSIPGGVTRRNCIREGDSNSGRYSLLYWGRDSNGNEQGQYFGGYFYWINKCSAEPVYTGQGPWASIGGGAKSGSMGCRNGCDGQWHKNADATYSWQSVGAICPDDEKKNCESPAMQAVGYYWNPVLRVCEPPKSECLTGKPNSLGECAPEPCPEGMAQQADGTCKKKDNECPAGQVRSPDGKCLPGDGQCAKGEVRGQDGTCKKDADNDGNPDPVNEDSFSGGDDCSAPPSCSGSPIMCGQARIQWRIDCNTRKNRNIAGGTCASMPICTGEKCDAMEYSALLMQWRSACALEKMAQGNGSGGGENADVRAIRDALTGSGGSVATPPDRPASDVWSPSTGQPTRPDTSGYGWGRGCPQPPAIEVMGQTIAFDITPLCRWLGLGSYFVVGLAALFCLRIIASRDA